MQRCILSHNSLTSDFLLFPRFTLRLHVFAIDFLWTNVCKIYSRYRKITKAGEKKKKKNDSKWTAEKKRQTRANTAYIHMAWRDNYLHACTHAHSQCEQIFVRTATEWIKWIVSYFVECEEKRNWVGFIKRQFSTLFVSWLFKMMHTTYYVYILTWTELRDNNEPFVYISAHHRSNGVELMSIATISYRAESKTRIESKRCVVLHRNSR